MKILKKLSIATAGAVVVAIAIADQAAQAITFNSTAYSSGACGTTNGCTSSQTGATTIDFNSGSAPTTGFARYSLPSRAAVGTNPLPNATAPTGDTSPYLAIGGPVNNLGAVIGGTTTVTIDFSSSLDYFGLYWGSIDSTNSISFYNGTTQVGQTYDTSDIGNGSQYVNFFADSGQSFNQVRLSNTTTLTNTALFESDNHAYRAATAVPFEFSPSMGILALGAWGAFSHFKGKLKNRKPLNIGSLTTNNGQA